MQIISTFYSNRLAVPRVKKTIQLAFGGTNSQGGDQTYFFDRVEVIDHFGQLVDAGLINSDFSYPAQGNGYFAYLGGNSDPKLGWTFGGGSGIATNGSAFQVPGTPDGNAVCFMQGNTPPTTQNISLFPGKYRVRFIAAQRNNEQYNDGYVTIAGTQVMYVYPTPGAGFQTYITDEFTV